MHWGFDFVVSLNKNGKRFDFCKVNEFNQNGKQRKENSPPRLSDIVILLKRKKDSNKKEYDKVDKIIDKIYECQNIDIHSECKNINFEDKNEIDLPIEVILKLTKWLFIEQDLRYWNYSGRKTFYEYIKESTK